MGRPTGFLEHPRRERASLPVLERVKGYAEFTAAIEDAHLKEQSGRCMDCGVPFCHSGCPLHNVIPEWNDHAHRGADAEALATLHATNNFPEITGRVCPAPCEAACTLNINDSPVTIKSIEQAIIDRGWELGLVTPAIPARRTGKRVGVVGSGPAGLACAQELARAGHDVTVFEKSDRLGGLCRYGIPDFKLEKRHLDRRIEQMRAEGVVFRTSTHIGVDVAAMDLLGDVDALVLAGGSERPRDLLVPGRELGGIHFAMEYLPQQNRRVAGDVVPDPILATGKHVVVLGGGDTGSDCIGTAIRQGALSVTNYELMERPPLVEDKPLTWPTWPMKLRTSSSHEEGCDRDFAIATRSFAGEDGRVTKLSAVRLSWAKDARGVARPTEIEGSAIEVRADLVLLALGYVHPVREGMLEALGVTLDARGNVLADTQGDAAYRTSHPKVFTAGDMRRGQSLVVWAIREGRQCARAVDLALMGASELPG